MGSLNLPSRVIGRLMRELSGLAARHGALSVDTLRLVVTPEFGVLQHVADVRTVTAEQATAGVVSIIEQGRHVTEEVMRERLQGRTGGEGYPDWHDGTGGAPMHGVSIGRVQHALYTPEFGAVIDPAGHVMKSSVGEALFLTPTLAALPGVTMVEGEATMAVSRRLPHVKAGAVFMAWGGRFNYGHFLLDCLSGLAALQLAGLLKDARPITPPLNDWQKEGVRLLLGEKGAARVREIDAPVVRVDDAVFANTMDHFLHAPNRPLDWVREQMLSRVDLPDSGARRVYLSRRGDDKRRMVNEEALEAELIGRGFTIVYPQRLSVAEQIATFRDADVIVAPTGAALANTLFCKPDAKVFEIQPTNYAGIWARAVCHLVGADWHGFFAPSPLQEWDIHIEGSLRPGLSFEWLTPLDDFLAFLDART